MRPAAKELEAVLADISFNSPQIPVVQNVSADIYDDPQQIKQNLIKQLYEPVLWVDCVRVMHKAGVSKLIECGPGKVLCGLIKRIESEIVCFGGEDEASLNSAMAEVSA